MSDTEIRMMRYTIEQLSAELQATRQYVSDIETKLERTRNALDVAVKSIKLDKEFAKYMRTELSRAHKTLEIAVDTLKYIRRTNPLSFHFEAIEKALEQITALEQKD